MYEIKTLLANSYQINRDSWEQTRLIAYIMAQTNSKKRLKPTDILSFPWEEEQKEHIKTISDSDIQRLQNRANYLKNKI